MMCFCFFFKQTTAYELRISDWSSDVCSSDLDELAHTKLGARQRIDATETLEVVGHRLAKCDEQRVHRGAPQIVLGAVVVVEQRLGHPRSLSYLARRRSVERPLGEQVQRRVEDAVSGGVSRWTARTVRLGGAVPLGDRKSKRLN